MPVMLATAAMLISWLPQSTEMISRRGWSSSACRVSMCGCWRRRSCCRSSRDSENSAVSEPEKKAVESEQRHIAALETLYSRYGLPVPEDPWPGRVELPASLGDACCAAVLGERENAALYDRLIGAVDAYPDVQRTLRNLRAASQDNHLPAFERCVEREARGGEGRRGKGAGGGRGGPGGHRRGHGA
jgi:hypothetical protein